MVVPRRSWLPEAGRGLGLGAPFSLRALALTSAHLGPPVQAAALGNWVYTLGPLPPSGNSQSSPAFLLLTVPSALFFQSWRIGTINK